jgi:hypothetical protein
MTGGITLRFSAALAVVLTAGAVLVASAPSATATQGQAVIAGQTNSESAPTVLNNNSVANCSALSDVGLVACGSGQGVIGIGTVGVAAFGSIAGVNADGGTGYGVAGGGGIVGVRGSSSTGDGVQGLTSAAGGSGVFGNNTAGGKGVFGASTTGNGVEGGTGGSAGSGVYGSNSSTGYGVDGQSTNGIGVGAASSNGTALRVSGRAKFSTAGTAVIASGTKSVTVTLAGVTTSDFVLATVQGSGAFYVKNASAGSGHFTIFINKAPASPATVTVAYFVISAS